ncbi:hypothetical protein TBLA_0C05930 [Henningerozyma blattae CBS 6284]|uniref:F-box domain-containing protein n=1 Tax=Henningerozyma blattae (strain ATCC 34711 / CBS 6284 / DSM 70876 / NBRC 10599 / NRRL Y-10934 / UCD 77-7) TaxID=1071380 RepID=I2H1Y8_HENB6|nr:hypothetical protein TBLA_0C05930 [Tetrapisispora blattae CBS 6284]CCH60390.1 hypothetical protein TBLA_0C05930 [Tetrapisispora blattae CBS 6284]
MDESKPNSVFPWDKLSDDLLFDIFSSLPQPDRLSLCLVNKRCNRIATKLIYRRIYLNDSNVVTSDFMDLAINWTLLMIPSYLPEERSRLLANKKLKGLIKTFIRNPVTLKNVQWIRINWDLEGELQKRILELLCSEGTSLQRLENITDPSCNDIIANGKVSKYQVTSFDMAPPNSLPELPVPENYIPNLKIYLRQRISSRLSHMTLFIDPLKLFNYLYLLKGKLQIVDLKFHWRREFFDPIYFKNPIRNSSTLPPLRDLSEIFDVRSLKVLTVISWNEQLLPREVEMIKNFKEFIYLEDLSLISIKQDTKLLVPLFEYLKNLKRIKMDFLQQYSPESTNPEIFLTILLNCNKLQFIDMRFEGMDLPIISIKDRTVDILQKCQCNKCNHVFNKILKEKLFLFSEDIYLEGDHEAATKDIFTMMRALSLLPYSKACDSYPSVRTQPMNLHEFVNIMNDNLFSYRKNKNQLVKDFSRNIFKKLELNDSLNLNNDDNNDSHTTPLSFHNDDYREQFNNDHEINNDNNNDEYTMSEVPVNETPVNEFTPNENTNDDLFDYPIYNDANDNIHQNRNENENAVIAWEGGNTQPEENGFMTTREPSETPNDELVETEVEVEEDGGITVNFEPNTNNGTINIPITNFSTNASDASSGLPSDFLGMSNILPPYTTCDDDGYLLKLPHEVLTEKDVIDCYHALIHHYRATYIAFLRGFPKLRFLMLNDIPSVVVEENCERIFQPALYHADYKTNLTGWSCSNSNKNGR